MLGQGCERSLLFLDNLAVQQTEDAREVYEQHDIKAYFFPPNCTDIIQPVDRHLAQQFKKGMAKLLDERLVNDEQFRSDWFGLEDGTFPAWRVRVEITKFAAEAWDHLVRPARFPQARTGNWMPDAEGRGGRLRTRPHQDQGRRGVLFCRRCASSKRCC